MAASLPQVYGSNQVDVAWTVIPILIVVALFMATARVIADIRRPPMPSKLSPSATSFGGNIAIPDRTSLLQTNCTCR
jgi:heme/copper-type cytochrome/quinol oxidase subunit 2